MSKTAVTEFVIITASDIHISDTAPRSRIDDFRETVLGKVRQLLTATTKLGADTVIVAGDLFNLKKPVRTSHSLVRELIELFKKFPCPVYIIPGNHDLTADDLDTLSNQPLGVLLASGPPLKMLNSEILTKKGVQLSLVGIPYTDNIDLNKWKFPDKKDCIAQICAVHVYAGPKSGMVFGERLWGYDELGKLNPDVFVIGHYHVDQGIQKLGDKYFINLGAVTRGTLVEENLEHTPKFGFIRVTKSDEKVSFTVEAIPLNVRPAGEIFDLKKREEEKTESHEIQKFVDVLAASSIDSSPDKDIKGIVDKMDLAKAVRDKVLHFIDEALKP